MSKNRELIQAFVLCAGKGTRLLPLTTIVPKCLVPVQGNPVLTKILSHLRNHGITEVICNIGELKEQLENYRYENHLDFVISHESTPLGTAGGVMKCLDLLEDDFCIYYGDVISNASIKKLWEFHLEKDADISLYVHDSLEPWTGGVVKFDSDHRVISIQEKPQEALSGTKINSGIMIVQLNSITKMAEYNLFDLASDLLPAMLKYNYKIFALPISDNEFVFDMGTHERLEKANEMLNI